MLIIKGPKDTLTPTQQPMIVYSLINKCHKIRIAPPNEIFHCTTTMPCTYIVDVYTCSLILIGMAEEWAVDNDDFN